ncbi:MAG: DUF3800 domain-containing protein [Thermomicrobiales bacterium]
MARKYVFADESGNFDFSRQPSATRYFILTSITMDHCDVGNALLELRREMAWSGIQLRGEFHATEDDQAIRNEVFKLLESIDFRVDATILEKPKAQPHLQQDEMRFYKTAWYQHMKQVAPLIATAEDELLVVGASLGTKKKRRLFSEAIADVVQQTSPSPHFYTAAWSAACEPCLQVADYCSWAIQRKWERNDTRSYDLIREKIRTEFDVFHDSGRLYY